LNEWKRGMAANGRFLSSVFPSYLCS
jgi:hypothetical protein